MNYSDYGGEILPDGTLQVSEAAEKAMKSMMEKEISDAWDQVIERARQQGPEALKWAGLLRRRAELLKEYAFPTVMDDIYRLDLEIEGEKDTDENLEGWLWNTCSADMRAEAREEILKYRLIRRAK